MRTIKAITVCNPWAWAMVNGPTPTTAHKRYENRGWWTDYRGPVLIHAGKDEKWMPEGMALLRKLGIEPLRSALEFGAAIGVVDLVDVKRKAECGGDPFAFGPVCFELANPRRLPRPVPMRGQLSLWNVDVERVPGLAELLGDEWSGVRGEGSEPETREERIERAIAAVGPGRLKRGSQRGLF